MRKGTALTPFKFLRRSANGFPRRAAIVEDDLVLDYAEAYDQTLRLAGLLSAKGIGAGDRVAVLAPNTRLMILAHFACPAVGATLVALNIRLTGPDLSSIVSDADARLLLYDDELEALASEVHPHRISSSECHEAISRSRPFEPVNVDEDSLISLSYTSGTTGKPKGAMYSHRGAYLQSLAMAHHAGLGPGSRYLWTLPMFHCNGWCFPWAVTAAGATHVCLRKVDPASIWDRIIDSGVTHLCAAPTVLSSLAEHEQATPIAGQPLRISTGGAPPSPALLSRLKALSIETTHLYGLTETYGPAVVCDWQPEWSELEAERISELTARQGIVNILGGGLRIADSEGHELAWDGVTLGEVQLSGDNIMAGYYGKPEETRQAFTSDGWLRTGDLGVIHSDGYLELRDRLKDVIISGGENISSIEVEHALESHPAVIEAAVVGREDPHWGEVPVAFVDLRDDTVSDQDLIAHLRGSLARFKVPKSFFRGSLPKTPTGKVRKYLLRGSLEEHG